MAKYKIVSINDFKCYVIVEQAEKIQQQIEAIDMASKLLGYEVIYYHTKGEGSNNAKIVINFKKDRRAKFKLSLSFDGNKILRRVTLKYHELGFFDGIIDSYTENGVDLYKPLEYLREVL